MWYSENDPLLYDIFKTFMLLFVVTSIFTFLEKNILEEHFNEEMNILISKIDEKIAGKILQPEELDKILNIIISKIKIEKKIEDGLDYSHHFHKYGLERIHENLDFGTIFEEVENGGEIQILDTYIPSHPTFSPQLELALKRGVKIKILYVKPGSTIANLRSNEMGGEYLQPQFDNGVKAYRNQIALIAAKSELRPMIDNINLRYYEDLPCVPMYIIKNNANISKLYFSFFLCKESVNYLHFEVLKTNSLFADFERYFKQKWNENKSNELNILEHAGKLPISKNASFV